MDVIAFGQTSWDFCWTGKQQLASRLAQRGHRVLYVDPRWRVLRRGEPAALRALAPVRSGLVLRREAGVHVLSPTPSPLLPWRLERRRQPRVLRAAAARLGLRDPVVLTFVPRARRMLADLPHRGRVHYAIDEMTGFGGLSPQARARVRREEEACVAESDVVLAISPRLRARLAGLHPRVHLLPSGADVEHFARACRPGEAPHPALAGLRPPIVGFVGQVDERLDQKLVAALAGRHPGWTWVLAGRVKPGVDVDALRVLPNVHLLGYRPYEELPALLRGVDVAVVPFRQDELTHSSSPLKVYEYLAAGRPVVSTPLDGLGACREEVVLASSEAGFARAVVAALRDPEAGRARRLRLAAAESWERRVDALEGHLEEAREHARRAGSRSGRAPRT